MTGRAAAVRNRLIVAVVAALLAWLFDIGSDIGLVLAAVAVIAVGLAAMRGAFGGLPILLHWLFRYRATGVGLRELGDIIGEHADDMHRAGLYVSGRMTRPLRRNRRPRPRPDMVPRLSHRPADDGIRLTLEAVRAGMSQDEILAALPRLRSAWGVDAVTARALPGGRRVEFCIPMTASGIAAAQQHEQQRERDRERHHAAGADRARVDRSHDGHSLQERRDGQARESGRDRDTGSRAPDAPPVQVLQGRQERQEADRPPTITPRRYEGPVTPPAGLPAGPVRRDTHAQQLRVREPEPRTDEILLGTSSAPSSRAEPHEPGRVGAPVERVEDRTRDDGGPSPERGSRTPPSSREPVFNGGERPRPTDVDDKTMRVGALWRTGREKK